MKPSTFKKSCNKISKRLLGFECFDEFDSYGLNCLVENAIKNKQTPVEFVRFEFEEDLSKKDYDKYLRKESENQYETPI